MSPTYSVLPKDYAPFSPFGDGRNAVSHGRFFACQDRCPDDASWSMYLWAATEDQIILNGKAVKADAHWIDRDDGRAVYIGNNVPQQTDDFICHPRRGAPRANSPSVTHATASLHALVLWKARCPTDTSHALRLLRRIAPKGRGRQGGVLPAQIFVHFYGEWSAEMEKPSFPDELAWHFAHEAAHLYHRHTSTTSGDE